MNYQKPKAQFLIFLLVVILFSECKREITENIERDTFLQSLNTSETQECSYLRQTNDDGFLILSNTALSSKDYEGINISITKTDKNGKPEWANTLFDTFIDPHITPLMDGGILVNSFSFVGNLMKIDKFGNLVFNKNYTKPSINPVFSAPVEAKDGYIYIARSDGWATGKPSTNDIFKLDPNGQYLSAETKRIADADLGGKVYNFRIYKYENPETYYLYGLILLYPWDWGNNPRLFVSKIQYSRTSIISKKTTILDPNNISNINTPFARNHFYLKHISTPDGMMVISTFQKEPSGTNKGYVVKVNQNLEKVWELDLRMGGGNTISKSISIDADGNYLVCGSCLVNGKFIEQPFACTISPDGKILWSKIFSLPQAGSFNYGFKNQGHFFFGGTTNGFGSGKNLNDVFILKTDLDGNLK